MKHIRNYARVLSQTKRHYRLERQKNERELKALRSGSWRKDERPLGLCRFKDESDESFEIRLKKELDAAIARCMEQEKFLRKWEAQELKRLETADKAGALHSITIKVNWKKSRIWGMNPNAEAWVYSKDAEGNMLRDGILKGHASGCGYDKLSAAVSEALASNPAMDRYCIEHSSLWELYAVEGRKEVPHFSFGGKGMTTFEEIFKGTYPKENGYNLVPHKGCPMWNISYMSGEAFDGWEITRKGK